MTATEAEPADRGGLGGWIERDRVRAVAAALIVVNVLVRAEIATGGFLAYEDFILGSRSLRSDFGGFTHEMWNNHLMPGAMAVIWLVTHLWPVAYWPYALLMLIGQAAVGIAFYRLLRRLLPPGWGVLVPLCLLLFSPLSLEATSWWVVGVNHLPMQLAMVWGIGAQVSYAQTRRRRHLASLGGALVFGLLFFEKSLLIVPLVFIVTACLLVRGGPVRSVIVTVRRYVASWLVLAAISLAYLALYLTLAESAGSRSLAAGQVWAFVKQALGSALVPGIVGGPWRWLDTGDGTPMAYPPESARWLSGVGILLLVGCTIWRRPTAARAWLIVALYTAMDLALLSATRLEYAYSALVGLLPRYVADVVPVAALSIGVALFGLSRPVAVVAARDGAEVAARDGADVAARDGAEPERAPRPLPGERELARTLAGALPPPLRDLSGLVTAVALVALLASALVSAMRFGDDWAVKAGRDYVRTVQAELAKAPRGTVFFDAPVPERVVPSIFHPENQQSYFLRQLHPRPKFVTAAEHPSIIDDFGVIRPVAVAGPSSKPGPASCGYEATGGQAVRIEMPNEVFTWLWAVRVRYQADAAAPAVLSFGDTRHRFDVRPGANQFMVLTVAGGTALEFQVLDPQVRVCVSEVTVGNPRPET
jgi:hypothetical protein